MSEKKIVHNSEYHEVQILGPRGWDDLFTVPGQDDPVATGKREIGLILAETSRTPETIRLVRREITTTEEIVYTPE